MKWVGMPPICRGGYRTKRWKTHGNMRTALMVVGTLLLHNLAPRTIDNGHLILSPLKDW